MSRTLFNGGLPSVTPIQAFNIWHWTTLAYLVCLFIICTSFLYVTDFILGSYVHLQLLNMSSHGVANSFCLLVIGFTLHLCMPLYGLLGPDRKSTRLNSSHQIISYAVFCLKKKNTAPTPYCISYF